MASVEADSERLTEVVKTRVSLSMRKQLEDRARRADRDVSSIIRIAVRRYLADTATDGGTR